MTHLADKVPEEVIVNAFAGIMAISGEIYAQMLERIAVKHNVPCDDAFRDYVTEVLKKQPQVTDW